LLGYSNEKKEGDELHKEPRMMQGETSGILSVMVAGNM
jgi:hypothetical protein